MNTTTQIPPGFFDRTGFPMIHIPALNAWLGWLPVTMVQLEYFLCEQPDPRFDNLWYQQLEHAQNRVTPHDITKENLYRLFATQLTPADIDRYCEWLGRLDGESYRLPASREWVAAYRELQTRQPGPRLTFPRQHERTRTLLDNVSVQAEERFGRDLTLSEQMLMDGCVRELTTSPDGKWFTHGRPQVTQSNQKNVTEPALVSNPRVAAKDIGFRILRDCR